MVYLDLKKAFDTVLYPINELLYNYGEYNRLSLGTYGAGFKVI